MTNRTEWSIFDIGALQVGAQTVPIYPTISEDDYAYILNHSESKIVVVSCQEVLDKVLKISNELKTVKEIYSFDQLEIVRTGAIF